MHNLGIEDTTANGAWCSTLALPVRFGLVYTFPIFFWPNSEILQGWFPKINSCISSSRQAQSVHVCELTWQRWDQRDQWELSPEVQSVKQRSFQPITCVCSINRPIRRPVPRQIMKARSTLCVLYTCRRATVSTYTSKLQFYVITYQNHVVWGLISLCSCRQVKSLHL